MEAVRALAVQTLYDRYGAALYTQAADDPALSAAITEYAASLRTMMREVEDGGPT